MPPADNSRYLGEAARRRSADTRRRALAAIADLTAASQPVTPTTVARRARVSRQWLYTCDDAMNALAAAQAQPNALSPVRAAPPATAASLRRRLEATTDDNRRLRQRVADLEAQLAGIYGELRAGREDRCVPGAS